MALKMLMLYLLWVGNMKLKILFVVFILLALVTNGFAVDNSRTLKQILEKVTNGDELFKLVGVVTPDTTTSFLKVDSSGNLLVSTGSSTTVIDSIRNIANLESVDLIDFITLVDSVRNIGNVESVDLVDLVTLVDSIRNIANLESLDLIDVLALVDLVTLVDSIRNIGNLESVDLVDVLTSITNEVDVDINSINTADTLAVNITNSSITIVLPSYSNFVGDTLYANATADSVVFATPLKQFSFDIDSYTEDILFKLNDQTNWVYLLGGRTFSITNISLTEFKYKRAGSTNVFITYEGVY